MKTVYRILSLVLCFVLLFSFTALAETSEESPAQMSVTAVEPTAMPTSEAAPEVSPAPDADATAVPDVSPTPSAEAAPEVSPAPDAEATVAPDVSPAPSAEVAPEVSPAPDAEATVAPDVSPAPSAEPTPEASPAPDAEATVAPDVSPAPSAEPTPEVSPAPDVEITVAPDVSPAPSAEPTPEVSPAPDVSPDITPEVSPSPDIETTAEPTPEPTEKPFPGLQLNAQALVLGKGEKFSLIAAYDDGQKYETCYSSENTKIAKVDKKGRITAVSVGETRILAASAFGEEILLPVTVKKAPKSLQLDVREAYMGEGQVLQVTASIPEDSAGKITWTSNRSSVASVDQSGCITAVGPGAAYVKARAYNGKYMGIQVRVYAAPEALELKDAARTLGVGQPYVLELKEELPAVSYSFSCDDPGIAAIDAEGNVTALAPGETILRCLSYNGLSAQCRLSVVPAPQGIAFQEKEITICVKDSYTLLPLLQEGTPGVELSLKSGNTRRFSLKGSTLTARSTGSATLSASSYNGHTASITVNCVSAPKAVSFVEEEITLFLGTQISPRLNIDCSFRLSSADPAIAAVEGGSIRAIAPGDTCITATTFNKKTAELRIHVPPLPDSVTLEAEALRLGQGDSLALSATLPEGQGSSLSYTSSDSAVAAVSPEGMVCACAPGEAVIRVTTLNGCCDSCAVTVLEAPEAVRLSPEKVVRSLDEGPFRLEIDFESEGAGGRYTLSSSDPTVATVASDGSVQPLAPGKTTITIETYNGLRAAAAIQLGEKPAEMHFPGELRIALGDAVLPEVCFDKGCEGYVLSVADESIAVLQGERLKALSLGSTTLTAVSTSGLSARCTLTVLPPPSGLQLSHSMEELVLGVSPALQLTATALPDGVGSVTWSSSDPTVASVDEYGRLAARGMGDCTITATSYDGLLSADCTIHVAGILKGVKIGVDPGHQREPNTDNEYLSPDKKHSKDKVSAGTTGKATGIREYETNLAIGLKLRDALEAVDATVYMTRETHDVDISNQERAKMMNALGCDVVLHIHCNSASKRSVRGMCIYVRETGVGKEESALAAQLILDAMLAETGAVDQGVKESDKYTGLNWSTVPSMLMELGYMSNYAEDRLLNSPDYQDKMVRGMVSGICAYMGRPTPEEILALQEAAQ